MDIGFFGPVEIPTGDPVWPVVEVYCVSESDLRSVAEFFLNVEAICGIEYSE